MYEGSRTRRAAKYSSLLDKGLSKPRRHVYAYDDEKRTKEVATYDAPGALKKRLLYSLYEKGNDAGVKELNADGSPKPAGIRWFDEKAGLRTVSGTPTAEFVYDARGN